MHLLVSPFLAFFPLLPNNFLCICFQDPFPCFFLLQFLSLPRPVWVWCNLFVYMTDGWITTWWNGEILIPFGWTVLSYLPCWPPCPFVYLAGNPHQFYKLIKTIVPLCKRDFIQNGRDSCLYTLTLSPSLSSMTHYRQN